MTTPTDRIPPAQVVLPCNELQATLDYFVERLGFRLDRIAPADDPREAHLSGHGLNVLLRRDSPLDPGLLVIHTGAEPIEHRDMGNPAGALVAPNGTRIEFAQAGPDYILPPLEQQLVLSRAGSDSNWIVGRAGMQYRDLIPGRLGGRFIASHIRIPEGGPVPDHVHHHGIRFQMIFCAKGWVKVAYEDQGQPILLKAGDCFLQPPHIRHRVLESSQGLEVVEIATPGEHDTFLDYELTLPTADIRPDRDFGGQRFVYHDAADAEWQAATSEGFEIKNTGIDQATDGMADVSVLRSSAPDKALDLHHTGEFLFLFVLEGELALDGAEIPTEPLCSGDSLALPAAMHCSLRCLSRETRCLLVRFPCDPRRV